MLTILILILLLPYIRTQQRKFSEELGHKKHPPIANRTQHDYETCIKEKRKHRGEAILVVAGLRVELKCGYCAKPNESVRGIWKVGKFQISTIGGVLLDGDRTRVLADLTLVIVHPRKSDSGEYYCVMYNQLISYYNLDVVDQEPHYTIIQSGKKVRRLKNLTLEENNLKLYSKWSGWSTCDRCGSVGRRRRIGVCMVRKIKQEQPTRPIDVKSFSSYYEGLPCRSLRLPNLIKDLREIRERKSEYMIGFCKIECPTVPPIRTITDDDGNVQDVVDPNKGEFPFPGKLPAVPAFVKRLTMYEAEGTSILLICPGNEGNYLMWRNGSWVINPAVVHQKTKGRVLIDMANVIHIRKLYYSDTSIYSCWEDKRLVGTIRLYVTPALPVTEIKSHLLNIALLFTIITLVYIAVAVARNRKLRTSN